MSQDMFTPQITGCLSILPTCFTLFLSICFQILKVGYVDCDFICRGCLRGNSAVHPRESGIVAYDVCRDAEAADSFLPEETGLVESSYCHLQLWGGICTEANNLKSNERKLQHGKFSLNARK